MTRYYSQYFEDLEVCLDDDYYNLTGTLEKWGTPATREDSAEWEYAVKYEQCDYQYKDGEEIEIDDIPDLLEQIINLVEFEDE